MPDNGKERTDMANNEQSSASNLYYRLPADVAARTDLTATAKVVYAILADQIGPDGTGRLSVRRLAGAAGISVDGALGGVGRLEEARPPLLVVERPGIGLANVYKFPPRTAAKDDATRAPATAGQSAETGSGKPVSASASPPANSAPPTTQPQPITWTPSAGYAGISDADLTAWTRNYPGVNIGKALARFDAAFRKDPAGWAKDVTNDCRPVIVHWLGKWQQRAEEGRQSASTGGA
jgi:hypothetical protein